MSLLVFVVHVCSFVSVGSLSSRGSFFFFDRSFSARISRDKNADDMYTMYQETECKVTVYLHYQDLHTRTQREKRRREEALQSQQAHERQRQRANHWDIIYPTTQTLFFHLHTQWCAYPYGSMGQIEWYVLFHCRRGPITTCFWKFKIVSQTSPPRVACIKCHSVAKHLRGIAQNWCWSGINQTRKDQVFQSLSLGSRATATTIPKYIPRRPERLRTHGIGCLDQN